MPLRTTATAGLAPDGVKTPATSESRIIPSMIMKMRTMLRASFPVSSGSGGTFGCFARAMGGGFPFMTA